jgi:hypothetical protein
MTNTSLSPSVTRYIDLADGDDKTRAIDVFADDAVVTDDGRTYSGRDAVLGWLGGAASEFSYTSTTVSASESNRVAVVERVIEGNFPGGRAQLTYTFGLAPDGLIRTLRIGA